jgi:hypothetical protein
MRFNPLHHPCTFMIAQMLNIGSGWLEHIPFAFLLIDLARPNLLVELGTYKGDSYCGFCQAIAALRLPTKCFAIDSWQGDPHMGVLPQDVLAYLRKYHDPLYGSFSTLVPETFDQAVAHFDDGSIDVLHIDGTHTFEAVQHDFQTWRPKLSDKAIILLHDTAVMDEGFGVYKFWEQIHTQYPSFEFKHGHGLGILGVGKSLPAKFAEFLEDATADPQAMRDCFAILGERNDIQCWLIGVLQALNQQYKFLNQFKQQIGVPADAAMEDFQQALKDPFAYATRMTRELQVLISDDVALRKHILQNPQPGK